MKNIETHQHDHHDNDHPHPHKVADSFEELRTMAIESLLIEQGLISAQNIDELIQYFVSGIGPMNGAKVVARAWVDPEFKERLLQNANKALSELGFENTQSELIVLANKANLHHVVVCTLCSCYPWILLGLPPTWYKSLAYRSRAVIDPRGVLREFGLELDESVEIRVVDSNAEVRYIVLPLRPQGTEHMTEEELTALVTRDSMIGVNKVAVPE